MDEELDRYARLVAQFGDADRSHRELDRVAEDADLLAASTGSPWLRVQSRALGAAARVAGGADVDLATIVDATAPAFDEAALGRLEELLSGSGPLASRLAAHDAATAVPGDSLPAAAQLLLHLLGRRAAEDLGVIHAPLELSIVVVPSDGWHGRLDPDAPRLVLNAGVAWTADRLVRTISQLAYPGRHLARLLGRPTAPEWNPSPETTVNRGLAAVGREVLLADHELAWEIERMGRAIGRRWNGDVVVAVGRARADLAPAFASAASASVHDDVMPRLTALGVDSRAAAAMVANWRDPLARASSVARAAGPPLVRSWLVSTGQTVGLRRLLAERLVPTMLRAEVADAAG